MKIHPKSSLARIRRPSTVVAVGLGIAAVTVAYQYLSIALTDMRSTDGPRQQLHVALRCQALVWTWWLLSPMASYSSWRFPLLGEKRWRNTFLHCCIALSFSTVAAGLYALIEFGVFRRGWDPETVTQAREAGHYWYILVISTLAFVALPSLVTYWLIVTITHAGQQERQLAEKEAELTRAQLEAVRMQMSPHFLFNALNSVSALASSESPEKATDLIARLGRALRESLAVRDESMTDLENELDMLEDLVEIERARFGDKLELRIVATQDAMQTEVPRWLLQPLVENAIVHGIAPEEDGGTLTITARIVDGPYLELIVIDDGAGLNPDHSEGIGIGHTRRRLQALFGARAGLTLITPPEGGTRATLTIPVIEEAADAA